MQYFWGPFGKLDVPSLGKFFQGQSCTDDVFGGWADVGRAVCYVLWWMRMGGTFCEKKWGVRVTKRGYCVISCARCLKC